MSENCEFTPEFFNESSKAWMENKIRIGATYSYKCTYIHSNQKLCQKPALFNEFCKRHYFLIQNNQKNNKNNLNNNLI